METGRRSGEFLFNGYRVSVCHDIKALEVDSGASHCDGHIVIPTMMGIHLTSLTYGT
jgi:hypothetical protein